MSAPVPTAGRQDEFQDGRRLSTGNMLDGAARVSSSPLVLDAAIPPVVAESSDEDFNRRMRNMSFVPDASPPGQAPPPRQNYTPYTNHMPGHSYAPYPPHQQVYQPMPPSYLQYPSQQAFYEPPRPEFQLDTMHGMPGYPYQQGPVPRSNQSSSPSNYSTTPTPRPYGWGSPPMSPAMPTMPHFGGMGAMAGHGRVNHERGMGNGMEDYGAGMMYVTPPPRSQWTTPTPSSPYPHYTPYQQQHAEPAVRPAASPMPPQGFQQQRGSWTGYQQRPAFQNSPSRTPWSGPTTNGNTREKERKAYHPQAPARRSDWVMWVGNVPSTTSHEELWRYFNSNAPQLPGDTEPVTWHGPSSIFLISRSSCAFVNLSSQEDLDRAVQYFNGRSLRPDDPKCPRMVCRIRRKDDDLKAGVGAQRGTGMHREWIKAQGGGAPPEPKLPPTVNTNIAPPPSAPPPGFASSLEPPSPAALEQPPEGEGRRRESIMNAINERHRSSASMASTNSSFLVRNFPKRYFILKSLTTVELEDSVKTGTWKTQRHNEPVLDQAFRTAQDVILIFSANKSGEFFGYARMIEPIDKIKAAARAAQPQRPGRLHSHSSGSTGSAGSGSLPMAKATPQNEPITEEDETESAPQRPHWLQTPSSQRFTASSPGQLTPQSLDSESDDLERLRRNERRTESPQPVGMGSLDKRNQGISPSHLQRAHTLSPDANHPSHLTESQIQSFFDIPIPQASREDEASKQEALGGSSRPASLDRHGVLRKDTMLTPGEKAERQEAVAAAEAAAALPESAFAPEEWGQAFRIEWIRAGALPFHRIRNLRNPWNADREVKVSRDGTEIEPGTAALLLAEWDRLGYNNVLPTYPEYR